MRYSSCPACSRKKGIFSKPVQTGVYECPKCGAIFGQCYLGDSYMLIKPRLTVSTNTGRERYFDLTCLGSEGVTRRHGWFDLDSRLITQIG